MLRNDPRLWYRLNFFSVQYSHRFCPLFQNSFMLFVTAMPITVTSDMYNVRSNYVYTGSYMSATWHSFNFLCSGPDLDDVDILLNNIQLQTNAEAPAMRCPFDGNFVKSWPWLSSGYLMPSLSYLVLP